MQTIAYGAALVMASKPGRFTRGLERASQAYRRAAGDIAQLGPLVDNPTLSVAPGLRLGSDGDKAFDFQLAISQAIRLRDVADSDRRWVVGAAQQQAAMREMQTQARVQRAAELWLGLWQARETLGVLDEAETVAGRFVGRTMAMVSAGLATQADVSRAQARLAELGVERLTTHGQAHELGLALTAHLGRLPATPLAAEGPAPAIDVPELGALIPATTPQLEQAPAVRAAHAATAVARAEQVRVDAERAPRMTLGASLQREGSDAYVVWLTTTFQLPMREQDLVDRAKADAAREQAGAAEDMARFAAAHALATLVHEVSHQRGAEAAVRDGLLPPLRAEQTAVTRLHEVGEATVLEVLRARQACLTARRRLIAVRAARMAAEQRLSLFLKSVGAKP